MEKESLNENVVYRVTSLKSNGSVWTKTYEDKDKLSGIQYHEANEFLSTIGNILAVKGEFNTDKTFSPSVTMDNINRLKEFLNSKGMNVEPQMLEMFGHEVTRRILIDQLKNTNIYDSDINTIQRLMNLEIPMARYATIDSGVSAGFTINNFSA